jgi:uncharacterized DUF497 family protein
VGSGQEPLESQEAFFAIGPIFRGVITVVYAELADDVIRIISARESTRRERVLFKRYVGGAKR